MALMIFSYYNHDNSTLNFAYNLFNWSHYIVINQNTNHDNSTLNFAYDLLNWNHHIIVDQITNHDHSALYAKFKYHFDKCSDYVLSRQHLLN